MALPSNFSIESELSALSARTGASVEPSDITTFYAKNPEDREQYWYDLIAQYERRGASGQTGSGPEGQTLQGSGPAPGAKVAAASIATAGPSVPAATTPPTVGPTGLANPSAPLNYATMQAGPQYGYGGAATGLLPTYAPQQAGFLSGGIMTWVILGAVAVAAYYLIKS